MDKDRPGPPALDDNMEEEVPSTSVVQEQVSAGDWENVLIELSDSSSEKEAEDAHLEPAQKGTKRKRVDHDAGGSAPARPMLPPQPDLPGREAILRRFPLDLRTLLQAIGAAATRIDTRAIDQFFGSQISNTEMYIMYAMAIRQAIRDRRRNPASRRDQAKWRLQTLAAGWPMGYQAYSSWMYSYTDHQTTPTFVHLQATLGCTGGRRCHVTFSAGTFKPPRCTPGDRQWLYVQSSVGNIVQSCNPRYSIFFDYMAIHRSLTKIWEEILTPDQRVSFMEFLGFLQRTDLSYIKNFVSDALGTTSIQTPWIDDNPSTETAQAWNAGFLRGRAYGLDLLRTEGEHVEGATGETREESEDAESDGDDEDLPCIVSRGGPKVKRPPIFIRRLHRLLLMRACKRTEQGKEVLEKARGSTYGTPRPPVPKPRPEVPQSDETATSHGSAQVPEPPTIHLAAQGMAYTLHEQHGMAPCPVAQAPPTPLPPVSPGDQLPGVSSDGRVACAPVPAPAGPIVRPWEPSLTQAAGQAFAPVRPQHMPVEPVPVPTVALERPVYPKPVRPAPPKFAMQGPGETSGIRRARERWRPAPWTPNPPRSPSQMSVRDRLARLRAEAQVKQASVEVQPTQLTQVSPQQPMEGPLVPEQQMFPGAPFSQVADVVRAPGVPAMQPQYFDLPLIQPISQGAPVAPLRASMGPVPPVPATQPQYFDIPLTEPINQGASAAHFLPQQPMEGPLVPERWMFPGAALSQSVRPGVAQSQYFDLPLTQPINHGAPAAHFLHQPPMEGPWVPEQWMFQGAPPSQGTDVVQHQLDALGYALHGLNHPGVPVSPAVNQYHLSQAAFGLPIDEDESGEGSDTSEPCEALDLSIHGRPCPQAPEWPVQEEGGQDATEVLDLSIHGRPRPRTPEWPVQGEGGQNVTGPETRRVVVSAVVHMCQDDEFPDLQDPPDEA
ncbi:UNVERIFIED_ASMBLY: nuclear antigen EBNA-3A [human gammaherpesvirus 4]|nr:nuclear antigen EBNA-3A [human gammaherpesvirus 4]QCF50798.1 nuclear antigen EBNA-3A [human gammaherpesvirus 4]